MKKAFSCLVILFSFGIQTANADTATAQQVLAQSTTNPVCSAGYNGQNDQQTQQFQKDPFEGKCQSGVSYVQCLRQSWQQAK